MTGGGAIEIGCEQCTVWGQGLEGSSPADLMDLCGTGHFQWQPTRFALLLAAADDALTEIVRGDPSVSETGLRVAFNCSQRLMGCAQRLEGHEAKAQFGILCRDWISCGDSADAVSRLIATAKGGGL